MMPPDPVDRVYARSEIEVVGISHDHCYTQTRKVIGGERLNGSLTTHRHEYRRRYFPMRCV